MRRQKLRQNAQQLELQHAQQYEQHTHTQKPSKPEQKTPQHPGNNNINITTNTRHDAGWREAPV
jgi:hypothetical protein